MIAPLITFRNLRFSKSILVTAVCLFVTFRNLRFSKSILVTAVCLFVTLRKSERLFAKYIGHRGLYVCLYVCLSSKAVQATLLVRLSLFLLERMYSRPRTLQNLFFLKIGQVDFLCCHGNQSLNDERWGFFNILIFYFSANSRDITLKFIQDTYRQIFNSQKIIDLHRSKVKVAGTVHRFLKVQSYHKN